MNRLCLGLCVCLVVSASPAIAQINRIVDDDGQGTATNCDDASPAFSTVGAAITAAGAGDTVLVCPGTYGENINFGGKAIAVRSLSGPTVTILDGNAANSVVTVESGEGATSVLEGFTIRNGMADFGGGGIRISSASPVIRGNVIVNNQACQSPGIFVNFGSPLIEGNTIANNLQAGCTGGTIGGGIGILGMSTAVIRRNNIYNHAGVFLGGGIALFGAGPTIEFNVIQGNSADRGGGIGMINQSDANITGNVITNNQAASGGGIYWLVPADARGPVLVNNTIAGNHSPSGSGIFADGYDVHSALFNNTIVAAPGQTAVFCGDFNDLQVPSFRSNNVFSATGASYGGICENQSGVNGNISASPQFADAARGDYHLLSGSPNIDAGLNTAPGLPVTDLDDHQRVLDGNGNGLPVVDIGADEAATGASTPGAFSKSSPADGSPAQPTTVTLSWEASVGATSYQVPAMTPSTTMRVTGVGYRPGAAGSPRSQV